MLDTVGRCRCGLHSCMLGICRKKDRRDPDPDTEPYSEPTGTEAGTGAAIQGKYPGVGDDSGYRTCIK